MTAEFLINRRLVTRRGGGLGVTNFDRGRLVLTMWQPWAGPSSGRVHWREVSLVPQQAIRLAHTIEHPPHWQPVKIQNGTSPYRAIWQVFAVRHGNGCHHAGIGICRIGRDKKTIWLGISDSKDRTRATDCWLESYSVMLTAPQSRPLVGLLYFWAGAAWVGARRATKVVTQDKLYLEEPRRDRDA
jgi:hypothetical protein